MNQEDFIPQTSFETPSDEQTQITRSGGAPSKEDRQKNKQKYEYIHKISLEHPEMPLKELLAKHQVSFSSFNYWRQKNVHPVAKNTNHRPGYNFDKRVTERPVPQQLLGQNLVIMTVDDLSHIVASAVRNSIQSALIQGIRDDKVKIVR